MTDITEEVIAAVVSRLASQVTDVSSRIYYAPSHKTIFPFISYKFDVSALPTKDIIAQEFTITFNAYSQRGSDAAILEATRIGQKIFDALEKYDLTLSSGESYFCGYDNFSTSFPEEDGKTVVHVSRFKILTQS